MTRKYHQTLVPRRPLREGIAWLELLLAIAALALVLQLWPALAHGLLWAIDVRNWSRSVWFGVNIAVVATLLSARFAPQLYADWRARQQRLAAERSKYVKQRELKEQREAAERAAQSRKRRMY